MFPLSPSDSLQLKNLVSSFAGWLVGVLLKERKERKNSEQRYNENITIKMC